MVFKNREEAGKKLVNKLISDQLIRNTPKEKLVVLAIPRGGVVTAKAVADKLACPLSVVVTKKVGAPGQEELAVGAMAPEGVVVWDEELISRLGLSKEDLKEQIKSSKLKVQNYQKKFKTEKLDLKDKVVVVVDDGIATGATVKAAIKWLRHLTPYTLQPMRIVVATPVCAKDTAKAIKRLADKFVCLDTPAWFAAVGQFYEDFPQVTDEEVVRLLAG